MGGYYYQVGIAFVSKDWDNKIYPNLQELFPDTDKSVSMEKFIKDNMHPDYYEYDKKGYIVLKWNEYEDWIKTVFYDFFYDIACDIKNCDYIVIDSEGMYYADFNDLHIILYENAPVLRIWDTPILEGSWCIIDALIRILVEQGYPEEEMVPIINRYAQGKIITTRGLRIIRQEANYTDMNPLERLIFFEEAKNYY